MNHSSGQTELKIKNIAPRNGHDQSKKSYDYLAPNLIQ